MPGIIADAGDGPRSSNLGRNEEPIAIVGFDFRFPGDATSEDAFWEMLVKGQYDEPTFPSDRFTVESFRHPRDKKPGTVPAAGAHFLKDGISKFDASFFSITPTEAAAMDPMQRGVLEITYRALENAGISIESVAGSKTSVHVGCFGSDYNVIQARDPEYLPMYTATGLPFSVLSNRVSWFFDFRGPSATIDTACSSAFVALDQACQAIHNGSATMGVVAGCNLISTPDSVAALCRMGFLSPDGFCHSFDERASGYARGEGLAAMIVKPLSHAIRDNDTIRAVIRATRTNQDGRTLGMTQPSAEAQELLIRETYESAGLDRSHTQYVEAHGTGTAIGDPTEASAIAAAFKDTASPELPLYVGSVKANIGHLEPVSGLAGLIKTVLALEKGIIPPVAQLENLNPKLAVHHHLRFPKKHVLWPSKGLRRASINSFGFGGTNAHVVLEDAYHHLQSAGLTGNHKTINEEPVLFTDSSTQGSKESSGKESTDPSDNSDANSNAESEANPKLLVWSSTDPKGLERQVNNYENFLSEEAAALEDPDQYLRDLSYTLGARRSQLPQKGFAIIDSGSLGDKIDLQTLPPIDSRADIKLACIFTGQGAQWLGMGAELMSYPVFSDSLKASDRTLAEAGCRWSVLDCLNKEKKDLDVNSAAVSQPLCSAIQIALVDLLRSFQIRPSMVLGHSSGEIAAAYCIGAVSARSAVRLAYYRGTLSDRLAKSDAFTGAMMAAGLSPAEAEPYLEQTAKELKREKLTIACINSPESITISGERDHLTHLQTVLDENKVFARLLKVPVAYHSSQMRMIADEYDASIQDIEAGDPEYNSIEMVSSVTGELASPKSLRESKYWVKNLVSPVRFSEAVLGTIARGNAEAKGEDGQGSQPHFSYLEIGPHSTLQMPVQNTIDSLPQAPQWNYHSLLVRNRDSVQTMLTTIGKLHCLGHNIDLTSANNIDRESSTPPVMLTQLPTYAFDHSVHHWAESRLSKGMRFREHAPHDLLGTLVSDLNPIEPRWRSILQLSDQPSLEDHMINGQVLFPAAAMLTAAIEGARQLSTGYTIEGYEIRNVEFLEALSFSGNAAVEIETRFRQIKKSETGGDDQVRYEFRLYSYQQENWTMHCFGEIQAEHQQSNVSAAATFEADEKTRGVVEAYERGRNNIVHALEKQAMYEHWSTCGYQYGPSFQLLDDAAYTKDGAGIATLAPLSEDQLDIEEDHVVHPASLDCAFQVTLASVSKGNEKTVPTMVPTRITRLWIAGEGLTVPPPDTVRVHSQVKRINDTKTKATVTAFSEKTKKLCLNVEGLESTAIHDSSMDLLNQEETMPQLTFRVHWKPDLALLDAEQVTGYCWNSNRDAEREDFLIEREWKVSSWILHRLAEVEGSLKNNAASAAVVEKKPYMSKYLQWLADRTQQVRSGGYPQLESRLTELSSNPGQLATLTADLKDDHMTSFFVGIGENLLDVLEGRVEPHEVMFNENEAADFYQEFNKYSKCGPALEQLLDLMAHKNPDMHLLEIGGGTGATTRVILNGLRSGELKLQGAYGDDNTVLGADRFNRYDFTDISPSLLSTAQEDLGSTHPKMKFSVFDIEKEGDAQGYKKGSYDVVIAADVIHATQDLRATLQNVRSLLKKGGKLVMLELTATSDLLSEFSFGLLSGWWAAVEDYRTTSPLITESQWNKVLREAGFSGVDVVFRDFVSEECHHASVLVATAIEPEPEPIVSLRPETFLLIADTAEATQVTLAETIQEAMAREANEKCAIVSLEEAAAGSRAADKTCVFLHELHQPFWYAIPERSFHELQAILKQAAGVVWATNGGGVKPDQPDYGAIQGLSRTLRRENNECHFATVALEAGAAPADASRTIMSIIRQLVDESPNHKYEPEYLQINKLLCTSRVVEDLETHEYVKRELTGVDKRERTLGDCVPLKLRVAGRQQLHALEYEEDELPSQPLPDDEIEIRVMAAGCNFMDPLAVLGRTNYDFVGSEVSGIVTRVGAAVSIEPEASQQFKAGDQVIAFAFNAFRTHARAKASLAVRKPTALSYSQAASIPVNFCTAYRGLVDVANLKKGETVLIHAAAGGTGQAAVQIARHIGAVIFVTVGSQEKRDFIASEYGIPDEHILHSRDLSFAAGIMRLTQNQGVDVVFNSLAGEPLERSWECVGPYGRFIEISKRDIMDNAKLDMGPFGPNATFSHVDMESITRHRPRMFGKVFRSVIDLIESTALTPVSRITAFGAGHIGDALRMLLSGKHHGKVVVTFDDVHTVKATTSIARTYHFRGDATYVITGAFGGLGRSMIRWMVRRGARNLLLLSRSGAANEESKGLLQELTDQGIRYQAPRCDITNAESLKSVLDQSLAQMPPVRGCIQGAMLLQDQIFENMSHKQFRDIADPKIQGSWNLHTLLPESLDFFILLSSLAGVVGGGGQANYSLANAYQDGLAAYRVSKGLPAISLNLGPMLTDGYLSRNTDTMQKLTMQDGHRPVTLEELIAMLEFYCNPDRSIVRTSELEPVQHVAQLANGMNSLAAMQQKGVKKPWYIDFPLFGNLRQIAAADLEPEANAKKANARVDFAKLFEEATPEELREAIQKAVSERVEMALPGLITDESSYAKPLHFLGIDSLFALDLRNWLTKGLKCEISVTEILKLNINDVVQVGIERSAYAKPAA